jgi:hypothetical protein
VLQITGKKEFRAIVRFVYSFLKNKFFNGRVYFRIGTQIDGSFSNAYFISSEKGVYLLENKSIKKLFSTHTFGMAIDDQSIFLACSNDIETFIIKCDKKKLLKGSFSGKKIFCKYIADPGSRIHQISLSKETLWITCTFDNTIIAIDKNTGEIIKKLAPFNDEFGVPILNDHNHINSIFCSGELILFVAYEVDNSSMIFLMNDNFINGYSYPNIGVHDIIIDGNEIYFSDTFGEKKSIKQKGSIMQNGLLMHPEIFSEEPGYILRGMVGNKLEMIFGHSHKGTRANRNKGKAKIIQICNERLQNILEMPFSQIFDILSIEGKKINNNFDEPSYEDLKGNLSKALGEPVFQKKVSSCRIL